MTDERDPPIEALSYIAGVTVVDIGDIRVARGMSRRPFSMCRHVQLLYDAKERRIWCKDCENDVEPFDAFTALVENYDRALSAIARREQQLAEVEGFQARTLAAKGLDEAWRRRKIVPACPHCHHGLLPEDFKNGVALTSRPRQ